MMRFATIAVLCVAAAACGQDDGANRTANADDSNKAAAAGDEGAAKVSVAQGLSASPEHGRLAGALKSAGLDGTLSGAQPYTIFAPTDAAFQKLEGADAMLAPDNKAGLVSLLTGHIVPGLVTAEDLGRAIERGNGKATIATVGGGSLTFTKADGAVEIAGQGGGKARLGAERLESNGAIHSIDSVLTPR